MSELVLFDDAIARNWAPFSLTRPIGELLFGAYTQRARSERALGTRCIGYLGCPDLMGFEEPGAAPVLHNAPAPDRARIFLCSRVVLDPAGAPRWAAQPAPLRVEGRMAGWFVPAGTPGPAPAQLTNLEAASASDAAIELSGRWLTNVWDLLTGNPAQLLNDLSERAASATEPPAGLEMIGYRSGLLQLGEGVTIEPGVVFDFSEGPICLDAGVTVRAFTRLAGPAYVGRDSVLLGGPYSHISIGPVCKVHGELEASIVLGYSNKAHDGFLGHAYLGQWVNLGAMTTNSDLKNNYGTVRLWTPAGSVDTQEMKIGCLLGDHVKTGIGSLLNTGTVVGAGSNLLGTDMPPKYVPPFSWGSGAQLSAYDVEKFLATAEVAMARRQVPLGTGMKQLLRRAWQRGRSAT